MGTEMDSIIRNTATTLILMTMLCFSATTWAQSPAWPTLSSPPKMQLTGENDVAIIIAIEEYVFLPHVPGARQNAEEWRNFFKSGLGIKSIYSLTDREATHEAMLRIATEAAAEVKEGARLWFVFIGHGAPILNGKDGGLVAIDAQQTVESIQNRSLAQNKLLATLQNGNQSSTVVVLDSCFSGRSHDGQSLLPGMQPVLPVNSKPLINASTVILSAAKSDQFAGPLPGTTRPAFSYLLLGALRGWAADENGVVTAQKALDYTHQQLRRVPDRQQTPHITGQNNVILTQGTTESEPVFTPISQSPTASIPQPSESPTPQTASPAQQTPPPIPEPPKPRAPIQRITIDQTSLPYMRGICGDDAKMTEVHSYSVGKKIPTPTCSSCPFGASIGEDRGNMILHDGYVGNFNGDGHEYAILGTENCGGGFNFDQAISAVRKTGDSWLMIDYQDAVPLGECTPIRSPDKDRLLCKSSLLGGGQIDITLSLISITDGKLTQESLPNAPEFFDYSGSSQGYNGEFQVLATTQLVADLDDDGYPEIALGITKKRGIPLIKIDDYDEELKRSEESNFKIVPTRLLRIWKLGPNGFQRSTALEDSIRHPYLLRYKASEIKQD